MGIKRIYSNKNEYRAGMFIKNEGFEHIINIPVNANGVINTEAIELEKIVIFPGMISPLFILENKDLSAVIKAQRNNRTLIGLMKKKREEKEKSSPYLKTGIEIAIGSLLEMPDGTHSALVQGRRRVKILNILEENGAILVTAEPIIETNKNINNELQALMNMTKSLFENIIQINRSIPEETNIFIHQISSPGRLADMISSAITMPYEKRIEILEMHNVNKRLEFVYKFLKNELEILQIEEEIRSNVQLEVDKNQRDFYLREQVKAINIELGEGDIWEEEIKKFKKRSD